MDGKYADFFLLMQMSTCKIIPIIHLLINTYSITLESLAADDDEGELGIVL